MESFRDWLQRTAWNPAPLPPSPRQAVLVQGLRWILALRREVKEGGLDFRAMGLVYTTLLSLAPLLAVCFSVLKAFGVHNQLRPFLLELLAPLGNQREPIVTSLIGFVENIQVGVLGAIGLALLFYSVVSTLQKIEDCFNAVWRIERSRDWLRRVSDYISVLLVGPVLVFSALALMASMEATAMVQTLVAIEPLGRLYLGAAAVLPYALIIAAFTFVYSFMPNTRVGLIPALSGGVCAGVAWKLVGSLFGTLVAQSASYSAIYSGFAAAIVFMIWLYLSWLILLLGAVVSFYCQHPIYLRWNRLHPNLDCRQREELGLWLMQRAGSAYYEGRSAWTLTALAAEAALPWEAVRELLLLLEYHGLLLKLQGEADAYVPGRAPETIALADILAALRRHRDTPEVAPRMDGRDSYASALLARIDEDRQARLQGLSLRDLALGNPTFRADASPPAG